MRLPLQRIAELLFATGEFDPTVVAQGYSIDSRTVLPGEVFFAVQGERMDGHEFVEQALQKGAIAAVVRTDRKLRYSTQFGLIAVDDTLLALQTLAMAVRRIWGKPLIGITGSAGKTTTKDAVTHLLHTRFRVLKSQGNFNNHFGLPLTLLKLEPEHDLAVIEMGMSHAGEIAALARIALPEIGVVTMVAPVHLENFDSIAGIARAKYELIASLPSSGVVVLNADDEYVSQYGRNFAGKVITFGVGTAAGVRAENIVARGVEGSTFDVLACGLREAAQLGLVGAHNIHNALAAVAVALNRGLSLAEAAAALSTFTPSDKRGEVIRLGNITVINDCYNSNPKALDSMVDALAQMPAERRIVVAGEMLELGPSGEEMHRDSGRHMAQPAPGHKIDFLVGVQGLANSMVEAASQAGVAAAFVSTPEEAGEWLSRETRDGDVILLKASRGVKLERALAIWEATRSQANRS